MSSGLGKTLKEGAKKLLALLPSALPGVINLSLPVCVNYPTLTLCGPETTKKGTLANIVDPDEMPHNAAFDQGLLCLLSKNDLQRKKYNNF